MAITNHIFRKIIIITLIVIYFILAKQSQAATFSIIPNSTTLSNACESEVQIAIDTQGKDSNAADLEIRFDPSKLTILDSNPDLPGIQIKNHTAYEAYFGNQVNTSEGVIRLAAASFTSVLNGNTTFASIRFKPKQGITNATFEIYYQPGSSTDSNIAESPSSNDILTGVTNSQITFTNTRCSGNQSPTEIRFINPYSSSQKLGENETITVQINDELDGVDLNTIKIKLNNEYYYPSDSDVKYSGTQASYTITFTPRAPFPDMKYTILYIEAQDMRGNKVSSSLIFNIPTESDSESCPLCPPGDTTDTEIKSDECTLSRQISNTLSNIPIVKSISNSPIIRTINNNIPTSIKTVSQELTLAGLLASLISTGLIANILSLLLLLRSPQVILSILGLLRKNKPWGIVYDGDTHRAIPFAVLRLYLKNSKAMVSQTVTDAEGKYGFIADPGKYRLEVGHPDYRKTEIMLTVEQDSSIIQDISLSTDEKLKTVDKYKVWMHGINNFFSKISPTITFIGLILSSIAVVLRPNAVNLTFFCLYLTLTALYAIKKLKAPKFWGTVYDAKSNLLVPNVLVKIFHKHDWQMANTHITDNRGRFPIQESPGEYAVLLSARDYNYPSTRQKDLKKIEEKLGGLLGFSIKEGKSPELELYLDPKIRTTGFVEKHENSKKLLENFPSPF